MLWVSHFSEFINNLYMESMNQCEAHEDPKLRNEITVTQKCNFQAVWSGFYVTYLI